MKEYQTIISQSGTEHLVHDAPIRSVGLSSGRVQTLCWFHVRPDLSASVVAVKCDLCAKEARRIADMDRK